MQQHAKNKRKRKKKQPILDEQESVMDHKMQSSIIKHRHKADK